MTNIVARLREHPLLGGTVTEQFRVMVEQRHEAAAEIERLRVLFAQYIADIADLDPGNPAPLFKRPQSQAMTASRFFLDAVWQEAFEMYEAACHGKLWEAPRHVQEDYKARARKAFREYLAKCQAPERKP